VGRSALAKNRFRNLHRIGGILLTGQSLGEALPELLPLAAQGAGAEAAGLFLQAETYSLLPANVVYNLPAELAQSQPLALELLVSLGMDRDRPVVLNGYAGYVLAHEALAAAGVSAVAASPLLYAGRTLGLLALFHLSPRSAFTRRDGELVQALARQLSLRLEAERLLHLARLSQEQIRAVQRAGPEMTASLELPKVLDSILAVALDLVPAELAHIFLYDGEALRFGAALGPEGRWDRPYAEPRRGGLTYHVATTGQPVVVPDIRRHPLYKGAPGTWRGSIVGLPLRIRDRVVGVMNISRLEPKPFGEEQLRILELLANQAAIAVENARLHQDLRDQYELLMRSQQKLVQSEKMAAIGKLSAGAAHELSNPLTAVIGIAQVLRDGAAGEQVRRELDRLMSEAHRAGRIVRGLLDFARQHPPERRPVQVNRILDRTLKILSFDLENRSIRVTLDLAGDLPLAMADTYQLQQVFANLINNACEAMHETRGGGELAIVSSRRSVPAEKRGAAGVEWIRVTVSDDGPGIPPEVFPHIFEPFFTTKAIGKGTGLGLSVCHGIVSEHGGQIWAESRPGGGTHFVVEIPAAGAAALSAPTRSLPAVPAPAVPAPAVPAPATEGSPGDPGSR
jgi:signal transduction histidine kinase